MTETKNIKTLINDINNVLEVGISDYEGKDFGSHACNVLQRGIGVDRRKASGGVWFSNVGDPCSRKFWYKQHIPHLAEALRPSTRLKFLYGDLLEGLILDLARASGHSVEHEQRRLEVNGVSGRIDAVIDGILCDVKTASPFSFQKFKAGLRSEDDSFGYLGQLKGYLIGAYEEGIVVERNRAAFLVINKVTGSLCLDVHEFSDEELFSYYQKMLDRLAIVEQKEVPERAFTSVPEGKSGNQKLDVNCSYCEFRGTCWPGLRVFLYSNRPVFLTEVTREPNVPEVTLQEYINEHEE